MMFCCLRHDVETSCHKHFVVVSRHRQTPPLPAISATTCGTVVRRSRVDNTWPVSALTARIYTCSESRFLPIPPAFDAPLGDRFPSEHCHAVWYGKTRMVCLPKKVYSLFLLLYSLRSRNNVKFAEALYSSIRC